ncbi:hypothetical protein BDV93DRAFT_609891 [Ceratobasidium sp. AG-I]|nr:hypothetical protein BDV93DRAFT_609891 [Ceratobasidium sp. AG-I]
MSGSTPYTLEQMEEYEEALEMFRAIEGTKYLAIAACTILVYDIICTLDSEVKGLLAGCTAIAIPALVILQMSISGQDIIPNPAPDLITACHFTSNGLSFVPYIASIGYETVIFFLTLYKTWQLSKEHMSTPLMTRLFRDGSSYYFVVLAAMVFTCLGSLNSRIASAAIGSGHLVAVMASMCSRLILSTRSFYDDVNATHEFLEHEMNTLPITSGSRAQGQRAGTAHSRKSGSRNPPGELRAQISVAVEEGDSDVEAGDKGTKTPKARLTETRAGMLWPGENTHRGFDVVESENSARQV